MPQFKKEFLIKTLDDIEKIHQISLTYLIFLTNEDSRKILERSSMSYLNKNVDLKKLAEDFKDENKMHDRISMISNQTEDYLLREPITIMKEYCRLNNCQTELHAQKWFEFANTIRNYVIHGFLDYEKHYRNKKFPIKWNENEITRKEVKTSKISFDKFEYGFQMKLFNEIKKFAEQFPEN